MPRARLERHHSVAPAAAPVGARPAKEKQQTPVSRYTFVCNNPEGPLPIPECIGFLSYQKEIAPSTGTPHFQGYVEFKKPLRITGIVKLGGGWSHMHLIPSKGDAASNIAYTTKDDSRCASGEQVYYGIPLVAAENEGKGRAYAELCAALHLPGFDVLDPKWTTEYLRHKRSIDEFLRQLKAVQPKDADIPYITLYPWQSELVSIFSQPPDRRKVYWYWSEHGDIGKSTFCTYLVKYHAAIVMEVTAKDRVIRAYNHEPIVVVDVERAAGKTTAFNYSTLEMLKNGRGFNTMYEPGMKLFKVPHVIVFTNFAPDQSMLSADRWVIKNLDPVQSFSIFDQNQAAASSSDFVSESN